MKRSLLAILVLAAALSACGATPSVTPPSIVVTATPVEPAATQTATPVAPTVTQIPTPVKPTTTPTPSPVSTSTPTPSPSVTRTPTTATTATRTLMPTPTVIPMVVANMQCSQTGNAEICAYVSDATPAQNSDVIVYGRLRIGGVGQAGQTMNTTWHYKSSTPSCSGATDGNGLAQCSRAISSATKGYRVNVDVNINGHQVTTWFTPK